MVRVPRGLHPYAQSLPNYGGRDRRIPVPPNRLYVLPVTVDLGNDGMAPQVIFNGAGVAQAVVGPNGSGDTWSLDQCSVSTSIGQLDASQVLVFRGPQPLPQYQVAPSLAGGGSQFGMGGVTVPFGWFVWAVWSGGTAGALAFLSLTGTKTTLA